jgi:Kef-type K+ transport system membrane component KefB
MVGAAGDIFVQIGLVVIAAAIFAYILRLFRQPQLLGYILVGIIITPVLGLITNTSIIEAMSTIGVVFLLFIVGLEMDIKSLKNVARVATFGGLIQVISLFIVGYLIMLFFGSTGLEAAYVGLIIAFSSTMVVMKILSERRELGTLHGRIVVGMLLVQDIIAILALTLLSSVNGFGPLIVLYALLKFVGILLVAYICGKWIFPFVFKSAAKNQEILLVTSVAVCFLFSLGLHYLELSIAIGAFVAGVTLGNLEYNFQIIAKVKSLKDFFSLLFFVSLGMGISFAVASSMWVLFVVLLLAVLILKPIIIMFICSLFKYTKKPSFLSANALAQVGEFSLILAALGLSLGHISNDLFSIVVAVTIVSIVITPYYIEHNQWFYRILSKPLGFFDYFTTEGLEYLPTKVQPKIVLCGHNRIGYSILKKLNGKNDKRSKNNKKQILVVDFNPEIIHLMVTQGYHCIYGDATDDEIIDRMNLSKIKTLISTIPTYKDNLLLIRKTKAVNKKVKIIVTAMDIDVALKLYEHGADYVIMPHFLGGEHVSHLIMKVDEKKVDLTKKKKHHIKELKERLNVGHEHPGGNKGN